MKLSFVLWLFGATAVFIGAATAPVPVGESQSFSPVPASYATRRPSAVPWKTRLPAVARVPPFQGELYSTRQASFCPTGSQASSRPKGFEVGSVRRLPRFQPL